MLIDSEHKLVEARWQASDHWDERPNWAVLDLIVVHCVSLPEGQFGTGYPQALFCGALDCGEDASFADLSGLEVAPHLFIYRQGLVEQFVSFDKRAWHAGVSAWKERPRCNDFSVGIEVEGTVNTPFTLPQYDALLNVVKALLCRYPGLSVDALVGHNEIAPGRKQDPGEFFDWRGLYTELYRDVLNTLAIEQC